MFLSKAPGDVEAAAKAGIAAAALGGAALAGETMGQADELRIALDGDAVVFSDASEQIYAREGLQAFLEHEAHHARDPMAAGPFGKVLRKLCALREVCVANNRPKRIRTALVTARTAPAHARVIHTLAAWGVDVDEAHFVGDADKGRILAAFGAHIFFDDQERHVISASASAPAALVPGPQGFRPQQSR